jgi:uridine kinase
MPDDVIGQVAAIVRERAAAPRTGPFVVGINGVDAAGKTRFAASMYAALDCRHTCVVHLDDFHHPRAARNGGPDPIENYLERTFDTGRFEREILGPLRQPEGFDKILRVLSLETDRFDRDLRYRVASDSIVLIEGVFLFRREWLSYFDLRIFLSVDEATSRRRGIARDGASMGRAVAERYDTRYLPAQRAYLTRCRPAESADIVLDVNDWAAPRVLRV